MMSGKHAAGDQASSMKMPSAENDEPLHHQKDVGGLPSVNINIESSSSSACMGTEIINADGHINRSRAYYECTFCKRGFTNAQALGGHMNLHRKTKSKISTAANKETHPHLSTIPHVNVSKYNVPILGSSITCSDWLPHPPQAFVPKSSICKLLGSVDDDHVSRVNLSLQLSPPWADEGESNEEKNNEKVRLEDDQDGEGSDHGDFLDLELRLGR